MQNILTLSVLLPVFSLGQAKTFTTCELVKELRMQGFPEEQLRDWVCLVDSESSFRTDVTGPMNTDGSFDYGLFQINGRYWCSNTSTPGKECNLMCSELLTDDIRKASKCAMQIFSVHGFAGWYGWQNKCQGKPLPDISNC